MTRAEFLAQFPEFARADTTLVDKMLAAALLEIDADVWAAKADQGQGYLTAHKLALSPFGQAARMVINNVAKTPHGQTTFGVHYDTLVTQVALASRPV